jgi:hypothetical protein
LENFRKSASLKSNQQFSPKLYRTIMSRTTMTSFTGGLLLCCIFLPFFARTQFVDGCFATGNIGTSFASNANISNNNADLLSWTGSGWTGGWAGANLNLAPTAPTVGMRAIWSGDGTVWTTGGEGFGLRLNSALVAGTTYSFAFRRVSHGTGQNGTFAPTMYSNTGGFFGTMIGPIAGAGTSWTNSNITFTAAAANNGHTWLYFHNSTGSGMFLGCENVVLPMALKNLQAFQQGTQVQVEWQIQDEPDYVWHVVERSVDGQGYAEIGRVPSVQAGADGHAYNFIDQEVFSLPGNRRFYRIRSINQDGLEAVSPVSSLQLGGDRDVDVQLFPNPGANGVAMQASFYAAVNGEARYEVFDMQGKRMLQGKAVVVAGKNSMEIPVGSLVAGSYFLALSTEDGHTKARFSVLR